MVAAVYRAKWLESKKTAWRESFYSVKSSGNQTKKELQEAAKLSAKEYSQANQIAQNDIYVDDCLSAEENAEKALQRLMELEGVMNRGGFT